MLNTEAALQAVLGGQTAVFYAAVDHPVRINRDKVECLGCSYQFTLGDEEGVRVYFENAEEHLPRVAQDDGPWEIER